MPSPTTALLDALAGGAVRVVDLTQPLSEQTPVIQLPEPFANTPPLSRRRLSRYDDAGPAWAWDVLDLGEHTGTHLDAPIHWITGRDHEDVAGIPVERLIGPAVVIDRTDEAAENADYLLTVADLEAFEAEHGTFPAGAWLLFRTGWSARAQDAEAFLNVGPQARGRPAPTPRPPAGSARSATSSGSAWRRWASTLARPAASTRRSRSTTTCSGTAATASRSWRTSTSSAVRAR